MNEQQIIGLISGVGFLVLVVSALIARRPPMGLVVKSALVWVLIAGVLLGGFLLIGHL